MRTTHSSRESEEYADRARERKNKETLGDMIKAATGLKNLVRHLKKVQVNFNEYPKDKLPEMFVKVIRGDRKGTIARVVGFNFYAFGGENDFHLTHFNIKVDGRTGTWNADPHTVLLYKTKKKTQFIEVPKVNKPKSGLLTDRFGKQVEVGQNLIISYSENINGWYRKGYLRFVHVTKVTTKQMVAIDLNNGGSISTRPDPRSLLIINDRILDQFALERLSSEHN